MSRRAMPSTWIRTGVVNGRRGSHHTRDALKGRKVACPMLAWPVVLNIKTTEGQFGLAWATAWLGILCFDKRIISSSLGGLTGPPYPDGASWRGTQSMRQARSLSCVIIHRILSRESKAIRTDIAIVGRKRNAAPHGCAGDCLAERLVSSVVKEVK
ncbi:hypothetical protein B0H66DRAFT_348930 [Apodospora peruviana]|uniref:Uncharacterized protein n=1 Tax=Apodospora peruviana TaxID=516989 RepID=A0AAE0HUV3_9PEZI|nr:hypothetical protein B0H66DRAFT_348930 [Apodospora peruviana]